MTNHINTILQYGDKLPILSPERGDRRFVAVVELTHQGLVITARPGTVTVRTEDDDAEPVLF